MRRLKTCIFRGRERGQALVLFAGGLAAFLGLVGLSIDVGNIVFTRTDLQKMADAGAFAGSYELPIPGQAMSSARDYIKNNGNTACGDECIEIGTTYTANDTITVTTKRQVPFRFLKVLGFSGTEVTARAKVVARWVTGYEFGNGVFPYGVWSSSGGPGGNCPYGLCNGQEVVYRANDWAAATGAAVDSDWKVDNNKFKGYFNHDVGVYQLDPNHWQDFSYGGNAQGTEDGAQRLQELHWHYEHHQPIILPVINAARSCGGQGEPACTNPISGSNIEGVQFVIVAWVAVELTNDPLYTDPAFPWKGKVVAHYNTSKGDSGGSTPPPEGIGQRVISLVE